MQLLQKVRKVLCVLFSRKVQMIFVAASVLGLPDQVEDTVGDKTEVTEAL